MRVYIWFFMLCKRGAAHAYAWATPLSVSYSQRELLSEILTRVCHDSCSLYSSHEINDFNNELNYHNNCRNFSGTQCNAFKLLSWALIAHLSKYTSCTTVYNCKILILSIKSAHMSRCSACNMICNGKMMTIINKSAHCSRYTACNLHFTITYSIAIIKSAHMIRYTTCNTLCNGKITLIMVI